MIANNLTFEEIERYKKLFREHYGVEYSDDEMREAINNLLGYVNLLIEIDRENEKNIVSCKVG